MFQEKEVVSILGCGWVGLPLGEALVRDGFRVKGTTTSSQKIERLQSVGIEPFLINLNPNLSQETDREEARMFLQDSSVLIINIPPRTRNNNNNTFHLEQMSSFLEIMKEAKNLKKIIYVSSTSVYPEVNREVIEEDVTTSSETGSVLVSVEQLLLQSFENVIVLRCGGLMGYDRILVKYYSGQRSVLGDTPVNFVHRDDVIRIIETLLTSKSTEVNRGVYNVVSPLHPTRREVCERIFEHYEKEGIMPYSRPEYIDSSSQPFKTVSPAKLQRELCYTFLFNNPLDFTYQ